VSPQQGFWRRAVFSTDHKVIGVQYGVTALGFLALGFALMLLMRWQLAFPQQALPGAGVLGTSRMPQGVMLPDFYNQLGAMHGTIMVFLAVVPLLVGAFGNYLLPILIGADDMAFPRLNAWSYWTYLLAGLIMVVSFFAPGGAAQGGWTAYPPLANTLPVAGQVLWLLGMALLFLSSLLGAINILTTLVQLRKPGLGFFDLPFFCWSQGVAAFLLLLAFPPLAAAALFQLMDRLVGSSFFLPSGLIVSGKVLTVSGGGSPILWQHLFWFLAHPEVYVLILPALGIVAEVIRVYTGKPLWGYRTMVWAALGLGGLSFLVWAHHMFLTGMGTAMSTFFQVTTMVISIPSVVILTALVLSLWGGSIRFKTPMLFAVAFLPMFGLGGLTGLPLGFSTTDIHLHDTYYVVGHFHLIVAPGTLFAIFAGIYHWFPRVTGRSLGERLGKLHFWPSLLFMNGIFLPMLVQGLAGVSRRLYDGGATYRHAQSTLELNPLMLYSAVGLAVAQVPFLVNLVLTLRQPRATEGPTVAEHGVHGDIPHTGAPRPDTGVSNTQLGMGLFLGSEAMLFAALVASYLLLRLGAEPGGWPSAGSWTSLPLGVANTVILLVATGLTVRASSAVRRGSVPTGRRLLLGATLVSAAFLAIKGWEWFTKVGEGLTPAHHTFLALYFALTGVHALHLLGGIGYNLMILRTTRRREQVRSWRFQAAAWYSVFVDGVWWVLFGLFYLV
jgi:cytochrome c oxidase subunit I